jgi:hypothetical protein
MASGKSARPKRAPQTLQRRATRRQVRSSWSGVPQFLQLILIMPKSFLRNLGRLTTKTGSVK